MTAFRKWITGLLIALTIFFTALVPINAYASGDILDILNKLYTWMTERMMAEFAQIQQQATDAITGKMSDIFKQQVQRESVPASTKSSTASGMIPYENDTHKLSYKNSQDYVGYTQGNASGVDAQKYPVQTINKFNKDYPTIQSQNASCQINVPQAVGDNSNNCTPAQTSYTNTMLTGVNPIPLFPDSTMNTAVGQQYSSEMKTSTTRTALSQLALDEASNQKTNDFIAHMQDVLQQPTVDQINQETPAAVARDSLILNQARAMLELRLYESSLMNERLLATVVAQNEQAHLDYIRKLGAVQAKSLHG